jgi:hypothetical protein
LPEFSKGQLANISRAISDCLFLACPRLWGWDAYQAGSPPDFKLQKRLERWQWNLRVTGLNAPSQTYTPSKSEDGISEFQTTLSEAASTTLMIVYSTGRVYLQVRQGAFK